MSSSAAAQTEGLAPVVARLIELLGGMVGHPVGDVTALAGDSLLRDLPLTSRAMASYLVAIEDEFGFEWDLDVPDEVFASFGSIAAYALEQEGNR